MRAVRIETDGTPRNTKVVDVATGEQIPHITAMTWAFVAGQAVSDVYLSFGTGTAEHAVAGLKDLAEVDA